MLGISVFQLQQQMQEGIQNSNSSDEESSSGVEKPVAQVKMAKKAETSSDEDDEVNLKQLNSQICPNHKEKDSDDDEPSSSTVQAGIIRLQISRCKIVTLKSLMINQLRKRENPSPTRSELHLSKRKRRCISHQESEKEEVKKPVSHVKKVKGGCC